MSDEDNTCNHCGMAITIRNPSGFCDHLEYPEYCDVCKGAAPHYVGLVADTIAEVAEAANVTGRQVEFVDFHDGHFHALLVDSELQLTPELKRVLESLGDDEDEE